METLPAAPFGFSSHARPAIGLSRLEQAVLFVGIVEISLQIDKYFFLHERDAMLGAVGGLNVSITTISLAILYGLWLADASLRRCRTILPMAFGLPMLVYLAINFSSAIFATSPMLSLFDFALLVQAYLLFFYVANRVQTSLDVLFVLLTFAVMLCLQASLMFYASAVGIEDEQVAFGPLVLTVWEGHRHAGTMHAPVVAGSTLALLWFPVATSLLLIRDRWYWRFALLATTAGLLAILMTQTRGAILTTALGSVLIASGLLWRSWLPRWTVAVAMLVGAASVFPIFRVYENRIQYGDDGSASSRKDLALIAFEMISERPFMGYGAGNGHLVGQKFADQSHYRARWYYTTHNKYLLVWAETGLVGLLAFLAILGTGCRCSLAVWRMKDSALSALGLAMVAALAGHSLHMGADIFNSRAQVQLLWCLLGLAAAVYKLSQQEEIDASVPFAWSANTPGRLGDEAVSMSVGGVHHG